MTPDYPERENMMMPMSGDDEKDAADLERRHRSSRLIAEGLCPNGHGGLVDEDGGQTCPQCKFHYHVFRIGGR